MYVLRIGACTQCCRYGYEVPQEGDEVLEEEEEEEEEEAGGDGEEAEEDDKAQGEEGEAAEVRRRGSSLTPYFHVQGAGLETYFCLDTDAIMPPFGHRADWVPHLPVVLIA